MSACGDPDHSSSASSPARQAQHLPSPSTGTLQPAPAWGHPDPPPLGSTACWAPHRESCWPRGTPCQSPVGWSRGPPPAEAGCHLSWQRCWVSSAAPQARIPAPAEGSSGKPRHRDTPHGARSPHRVPHKPSHPARQCMSREPPVLTQLILEARFPILTQTITSRL